MKKTLPLIASATVLMSLLGMAVAQQKPHAKVSAAKATAVAVKKYPGKVIGAVKLENEDGKWQYAVNVRSGKTTREVMVDATSGKIASMEKTTPAEEAKEAAAEAKHGKTTQAKHHKPAAHK